ncbi:Dabb family protein [Stagnihabitans tardus]|uniref:Dabb family protein n=1 Tax=Stagnihabitans tardus TaxID=2699202 RepID=A0AAE5BTG7_9RHOB|nr:Dabb family protein [Stagnihabitans tardus]
MIRHIVLIRFRKEVSEDKIGSILTALTPLCARLGVTFAAGRSESPEKIERGYMHGFTIDFADWEALATYANDPEHKAFGGQLVAHAEGGIEGILVFDLSF